MYSAEMLEIEGDGRMDYKRLYHIMVDASEKAIEAIDNRNYGMAKDLLIQAEQKAEELYIDSCEEKANDCQYFKKEA